MENITQQVIQLSYLQPFESDNICHHMLKLFIGQIIILGCCDFFLITYFATTEPESINWFTSGHPWSTGNLLTGLWRLLCLFVPLCYSCNLRSQMIRPGYEKPIDTTGDIFERGAQNVWVPHWVPDLDKPWEIQQWLVYNVPNQVQVSTCSRLIVVTWEGGVALMA